MKVRELQEQLSKLDPELELVGCSEDEKLLAQGRGFILFDVVAVSATEAQWLRLDDGSPSLLLGRGEASTTIAILEVKSDF